jgi:TnpA family transposase
MSEELRIEIHEAQNVVERLNSVMGFIFYGKLGELSTNIKEYQELGIICLHLLQTCMAYINTIIQYSLYFLFKYFSSRWIVTLHN